MCRLVAYLGDEILLEDVLVKPVHSIIMQSLHARESSIPTNGDGFGVGWYAQAISPTPALFTSISPAWNDQNLLHLTAKIQSTSFFAHVRAASAGGVTTYNCHPFIHGEWMLMHNGGIDNFIAVKRHLRRLLDDDIYNWIQGETDSEHFFALFLQLARGKDLSQLAIVADVFRRTLHKVNQLVKKYGDGSNDSYFNICITDGKRLIASRYCSDKDSIPESMHYFTGHCFTPTLHHTLNLSSDLSHHCVLIASEKLTRYKAEWQDVPVNHLLLVDANRQISLEPI